MTQRKHAEGCEGNHSMGQCSNLFTAELLETRVGEQRTHSNNCSCWRRIHSTLKHCKDERQPNSNRRRKPFSPAAQFVARPAFLGDVLAKPMKQCGKVSIDGRFICTEEAGHTGSHWQDTTAKPSDSMLENSESRNVAHSRSSDSDNRPVRSVENLRHQTVDLVRRAAQYRSDHLEEYLSGITINGVCDVKDAEMMADFATAQCAPLHAKILELESAVGLWVQGCGDEMRKREATERELAEAREKLAEIRAIVDSSEYNDVAKISFIRRNSGDIELTSLLKEAEQRGYDKRKSQEHAYSVVAEEARKAGAEEMRSQVLDFLESLRQAPPEETRS